MQKINLILLILWMIVIFIFSDMNNIQSDKSSDKVVDYVETIINIDENICKVIVRKLAHLTEYVILGILMYNCLKDYKLSIMLSILYACSDEVHQLFIIGRSGNIIDVLIDTIGIIIGIKIIKNKRILTK